MRENNTIIMAFLQYKKYIWLVDTIRSAGHISKEEIDRKWYYSSINENHEPKFAEEAQKILEKHIKSSQSV